MKLDNIRLSKGLEENVLLSSIFAAYEVARKPVDYVKDLSSIVYSVASLRDSIGVGFHY